MSLGHDRERLVKHELEDEGWFVARAAGSLGDADLVASRPAAGEAPYPRAEVRVIEVKANKDGGPYKSFGPMARNEISAAARVAGATAWLYWWPSRGRLKIIPETEWPKTRQEAA